MLIANFLTLTRFCLILTLVNLFGNLQFMLVFRKVYCTTRKINRGVDQCSLLDLSTYVFHIGFLSVERNALEIVSPFIEEIQDSLLFTKISYFFIFVFTFVFLRILFKQNLEYLRDVRKDRSVSEYTLMLRKSNREDFSADEVTRTDFKQFFGSILAQSGYDDEVFIVKKELASSLFVINKLNKEKAKMTYFKDYTTRLANGDGGKNGVENREKFQEKDIQKLKFLVKNSEKKLKKLEKLINQERRWLRKKCFSHHDGKIAGKVVLIAVSSRFTRDRILRAFQENYRNRPLWLRMCCRKKPRFQIQEGPEPSTTKWRYIEESGLKTVLNCLATATLTEFVLVIITVVVSEIQKFSLNEQRKGMGSLLVYLLALEINVIQIIGKKIIDKVLSLNRCPTRSQEMVFNVLASASMKFMILMALVQFVFTGPVERIAEKRVQLLFKTIVVQTIMEPLKLTVFPNRLKRYLQIIWFKKKPKEGRNPKNAAKRTSLCPRNDSTRSSRSQSTHTTRCTATRSI